MSKNRKKDISKNTDLSEIAALVRDYEDKPPTAKEMKCFASIFAKEHWDIVCQDQRFLDVFGYDLKVAFFLADYILEEHEKESRKN